MGIHTRRTVLPLEYIRSTRNADPGAAAEASLYTNPQTGAAAARMAIARAGIEPADIGLVIAGGCSPQYLIPAESCMIAAELGISSEAYDVNSACSSFAAQIASSPVHASGEPAGLRAGRERGKHHANRRLPRPEHRRPLGRRHLGGGDIAAQAVPGTDHPHLLHSDPSGWGKVYIRAGGHFGQNGPAVQAFAIRKTGEIIRELREHLGGTESWFIGHQANLLMLRSVCDRAGVPAERHLYNVDRFGNCGAAGAPGVLSQNWDRFSDGDTIALAVVGSGLTWGGVAFRIA